MSLERVETQRLVGTVPEPSDLDFLAALLADPRVGRTLGGVRTRAQAAELLEHHRASWERDGFNYWIWRERATGEPVARGGASRATVEGEPVVEIGWAVRADRWGEGFASELGRASMEAARSLGIGEVVAYTLTDNHASRRVMEKLGMVFDRVFEHGPWGPHALYRATISRSPTSSSGRPRSSP